MKTTNLEHLMQKYITGQVSEEEKIKIEAWLDVKKTEEGTDMVLDAADEERLFEKITARMDNVDEIKAFRPARGSVRALFSTRRFQVAAALLILAVASYTIWRFAESHGVHEAITRDNTEKVILEDGSIVWLREHSRLTYVANGVTRDATLMGEGLFEVAKDPSRPFTITCGEVSVRVVGTSFYLKSREEAVELKVLTGKVNLSAANQEDVEVASNEMVLYREVGGMRKVILDPEEKEAVTARTEYNMQFRNTTLEDVVARIEKKFEREVVVKDARAKKCRITADFTDHSLESTLQMIEEFMEIQYRMDKNSVSLTGPGCQ